MSVFIVSDLHIWGPADPLYSSLLSLLRDRAVPGDEVVLAGDVFDLFVGNKKVFTARYVDFLKTLADAGARGIRIHYIEGNHDFLIQSAFREIPRMTIYPHDVSLEIHGKKFYCVHGDTANHTDYLYRILRRFFRSPLMRALVWLTPGALLDKIGKASSQRSRQSKPLLPADLPIQRMEFLRTVYRSYAAERLAQGYDFVVMGHCHDLDEMHFNIGGRRGQYVNVGYPRMHGSFLSWSPGEDKIHREKLPD